MACNHVEQRHEAVPAFYHWQTKLQLSPDERQYLDSLGVKKLYAKFFDVDWDDATAQPVPLAVIEIDTALLAGLEIVPCVFITNRCLLQLPMQDVDSLAFRIFHKIASLAERPLKEIQFDCDWTERTREKYFSLLTAYKQLASSTLQHPAPSLQHPTSISATIRLHQFKYPDKTGVPPVDRGMLMCYNMGDLEDWATENSILDAATLKSYLPPQSEIRTLSFPKGTQFAIEYDFALPAFRWGVLFRDGEMVKLLNELCDKDLEDTSRFKKTASNRYEVAKSTFLNAHYLYKGDQIRLEATTPESLAEAATLINNKVASGQAFTVAFYHLDAATMQRFPKEKIEEVLRRF